MAGTRQQFVDAFLSLSTVDIFSPGEEILQRGSISSDLFLLLEGKVEATLSVADETLVKDSSHGGFESSVALTSNADTAELHMGSHSKGGRKIKSGEFLNELGEQLIRTV